MAGKLVYTIHTKLVLKNGEAKYPQMGAVIKDEGTGHLFFNLEMKPWKEWDGRGYLFIPKKRVRELEEENPETPPNLDEVPL